MTGACRSGLLACTLLAALVGGCASGAGGGGDGEPDRRAATRPVNLSGFSSAFRQGYADGCDSAAGSPRRNESRYKTDAQYLQGWDDGNSACRR